MVTFVQLVNLETRGRSRRGCRSTEQ